MSERVKIGVLGLGSVFEKYGRNLASLREQGRVEITALRHRSGFAGILA